MFQLKFNLNSYRVDLVVGIHSVNVVHLDLIPLTNSNTYLQAIDEKTEVYTDNKKID